MTQRTPQTRQIFSTLVFPLALGLGLYMLLGLLIDREVITNELLLRYLTGHTISRITTFMFCVGVAALLVIANSVFDEYCNSDKIKLAPSGDIDDPQHADDSVRSLSDLAALLLDQLQNYKRSVRSHYLWQRLSAAVGFIHRTDSAAGIEDELKYLSDIDHDRQQRRYSLVRIVIWATPMLGFLGTVLGISQALGGIQVGPDNDFQQMLNSLRGSLFVAFDTTALALTLSIILMFFQFFVDRFETQLLEIVDRRSHEEILPLYKGSVFIDPNTRAVEQIGRTVMAASQDLVKQQTDLWQQSMQTAQSAWVDSISGVSETVRSQLSMSLTDAVQELSDSIANAIDNADESMAKRWEQWQVVLSENARQMSQHQQCLLGQTELTKQLLEKIENTNGVQEMLNRNLDALAATSRLHETLENLAASIDDLRHQQSNAHPDAPSELRLIHGQRSRQSDETFRFKADQRLKRDAA